MTASDWRALFDPREVTVYDLLLDSESDGWHILDVIQAAGLGHLGSGVEELPSLVAPLQRSLDIIESVVTQHPDVFPPVCLRPGHYPWIRQRRDVHQFDVGSHLMCCCALTVREFASTRTRQLGATAVAQELSSFISIEPPGLLTYAAIFHDLFKCFRPRRPLPGKIGPKKSIRWSAQLGHESSEQDEVYIANSLLPDIIDDTALCESLVRCLISSKKFSNLTTRMRAMDHAGAESAAQMFWQAQFERTDLAGLALYLSDTEAKGFVRKIPTVRRGFSWSLDEVSAILLSTAEARFQGDVRDTAHVL